MQIAQEIKHHITVSEAAGHITLDYEGRFLRRKRLITDEGEAFLVELPETVSLAATDGFVLEDGRIIAILPKAEPNHILSCTMKYSNFCIGTKWSGMQFAVLWTTCFNTNKFNLGFVIIHK